MEATVKIDDKDVRFKATAAVPLLYRRRFGRDLLRDLQTVTAAIKNKAETGEDLSVDILTTFEKLAFIMAKHGDPDLKAATPEEWMDGFTGMSIYAIFPVILNLWTGNLRGLEESKKKAELWSETLQRRSCFSEQSGSEFPSGTST